MNEMSSKKHKFYEKKCENLEIIAYAWERYELPSGKFHSQALIKCKDCGNYYINKSCYGKDISRAEIYSGDLSEKDLISEFENMEGTSNNYKLSKVKIYSKIS